MKVHFVRFFGCVGYFCAVAFALSSLVQQANAQIGGMVAADPAIWVERDALALDAETSASGLYTSVRTVRSHGYDYDVLLRANESLRQRVDVLEGEVRRLRSDVQILQSSKSDANQWAQRKEEREAEQQRREKQVVCGIKTPFNGTFIARADTKIEALALALQKCEQSGAGLCPEKNAQCEKP
jgi:hypothetical protein